ncbi:MAG: 16S rRNA pseudouridine(516) synthase, partial [Erysipelotrichaceae bacterium]
ISVNGNIIINDDLKIDETKDIICFDQEPINYNKYVYIMINKPKGCVSATVDNVYPTVFEYINEFIPLDSFPVGRLDLDTTGLLIISNDGTLAHNILSPKKHVTKVYEAKLDHCLNDSDIIKIEEGIVYNDIIYKSGKILYSDGNIIQLEISEGKFHQVKNMMLALNNEVIELKRIKMGNLLLDESLELGEYRSLSDEEILLLKQEKEN